MSEDTGNTTEQTEQGTPDVVAQLQAKGLNGASHHAAIRKAYKEITGEQIEMKDLPDLRRRLGGTTEKEVVKATEKDKPAAKKEAAPKAEKEKKEPAPKVVKEKPTAEQALAKARGLDAKRWNKVVKVLEQGETGNITRVTIACQNPQTLGEVSLCAGTRDIAVQDLFQVSSCVPCQRRITSIKRNERTKGKRKGAREEAAKLNEQVKEAEAALAATE